MHRVLALYGRFISRGNIQDVSVVILDQLELELGLLPQHPEPIGKPESLYDGTNSIWDVIERPSHRSSSQTQVIRRLSPPISALLVMVGPLELVGYMSSTCLPFLFTGPMLVSGPMTARQVHKLGDENHAKLPPNERNISSEASSEINEPKNGSSAQYSVRLVRPAVWNT